MGVLDAPMAKVVKNLVEKFGRSATLRRYPNSAYDDSTGKTGATSTSAATEVSCSAVPIRAIDSQIPGTLIQAKDRIVLVAHSDLGAKPVADRDEFVLDSQTYGIEHVEAYSSGESDAAYELLLRR